MNLSSKYVPFPLLNFLIGGCNPDMNALDCQIYETSAQGHMLTRIQSTEEATNVPVINLIPEEEYQTITGFGGSFTEASAYVLNQLSPDNRDRILEAYFGDSGARYSLTRTHMNSCDFSLGNYSYAPVENDMELAHFSLKEDMDDIIPMIRDAMKKSSEGFRIIASPWTAPPWMKDNKNWVGGKLLREYYDVWALFFAKYSVAMRSEGIDIWAFTVENEPLGNGNNWESMHFTPDEMNLFVQDHLGPLLEKEGISGIKIFGYDQNREHLREWVDCMYRNEHTSRYFSGTAIHWYASTFEVFPDELQYAHQKAPDKHLIQTEACIDAEVPRWKDDAWYWSKEATDWGWDWAPEEQKHLHPRYIPAYRYTRDIIGCLNNWVDGWVDWNMVLDRKGGPNWFRNWCIAPVIADTDKDEVYFTPLYYVMSHFSRFIRPGAKRIGFESGENDVMVTAAKNPDGSIVVVVFNPATEKKNLSLKIGEKSSIITISQQALQTITMTP